MNSAAKMLDLRAPRRTRTESPAHPIDDKMAKISGHMVCWFELGCCYLVPTAGRRPAVPEQNSRADRYGLGDSSNRGWAGSGFALVIRVRSHPDPKGENISRLARNDRGRESSSPTKGGISSKRNHYRFRPKFVQSRWGARPDASGPGFAQTPFPPGGPPPRLPRSRLAARSWWCRQSRHERPEQPERSGVPWTRFPSNRRARSHT